MARQYLQEGPYVDPPVADVLSANTATTAVDMWSGVIWTPVYANDAKAGKIYVIEAGGLITTGASGTLTISPGFGTASPGTTLGASVAQTTPVSAPSGPWFLRAVFIVRTISGTAGANSTIIGTGTFNSPGIAATANSGMNIIFGGTSCLFDPRVNNFFTFQKTLSVAGSFTTQWAFIFAKN